MKEKVLSIIIPVFNIKDYIGDCIESIINQIDDDIEVIIIDDGSTDGSSLVVDKYSECKNIKVIHQSNKGLSGARNVGLKESCGKYILFVDGDDGLEDNAVIKIIKCMKENEIDVLGFNAAIYEKATKTNYLCHNISDGMYGVIISGFDVLKYKTPLSGIPFYCFRKQFLYENNLWFWEGVYYEDLQYVFDFMLQNPRIMYLNDSLYKYVRRDGSITATVSKKKFSDLCQICEKVIFEYKNCSCEKKKAMKRTIRSYLMFMIEIYYKLDTRDQDESRVLEYKILDLVRTTNNIGWESKVISYFPNGAYKFRKIYAKYKRK